MIPTPPWFCTFDPSSFSVTVLVMLHPGASRLKDAENSLLRLTSFHWDPVVVYTMREWSVYSPRNNVGRVYGCKSPRGPTLDYTRPLRFRFGSGSKSFFISLSSLVIRRADQRRFWHRAHIWVARAMRCSYVSFPVNYGCASMKARRIRRVRGESVCWLRRVLLRLIRMKNIKSYAIVIGCKHAKDLVMHDSPMPRAKRCFSEIVRRCLPSSFA
jgi:hypothetical protein